MVLFKTDFDYQFISFSKLFFNDIVKFNLINNLEKINLVGSYKNINPFIEPKYVYIILLLGL